MSKSLIVSLLLVTFVSCYKGKQETITYHNKIVGYSDSLYIDFQSGFNNNKLFVEVNGIKKHGLHLTSDLILDFADQIVLDLNSINELKFETDGKVLVIMKNQIQGNFLGIENRTDKLEFVFQDNIFIYE